MGKEPASAGISPAGEVGALECVAGAFSLELPFMKKVKSVPRIDSLSGGKDHLKEWSSGPQLYIQYFSGYFIGTEPLAKPEIVEG